jgi:hypothetical protein
MADNDNEGHSGSFHSEIKDHSLLSVRACPNVILLHASTNDMDLDRDVDSAPDRLAAIIDQLLERCPDASILVAQIIFSTNIAMQARTERYNAAIADFAGRIQRQSKQVMAVDMSKALTTADLADKKHPNDFGYRKMAVVWRDAIIPANEAGWIKKPVAYEGTASGIGIGDTTGSGKPCVGPNWTKEGVVADLIKVWSSQGQVTPAGGTATRDLVSFGDVDGECHSMIFCHSYSKQDLELTRQF